MELRLAALRLRAAALRTEPVRCPDATLGLKEPDRTHRVPSGTESATVPLASGREGSRALRGEAHEAKCQHMGGASGPAASPNARHCYPTEITRELFPFFIVDGYEKMYLIP